MVALAGITGSLKEFIEGLSSSYSYGGFFFAAFFTNLIPFFPAIYLAFLAIASAVTNNIWDIVLLTLSAGIGAGFGKSMVFIASDVFGRKFMKKEKRENMRKILQNSKTSILALVIVFAATPLPDDVVYIPLGTAGFKFSTFLLGVTMGKVILTGIVTGISSSASWLAKYVTSSISTEGSHSPVFWGVTTSIYAALTVLLIIIVYYVDWVRVTKAIAEKGWKDGAIIFTKEFKRAMKGREKPQPKD